MSETARLEEYMRKRTTLDALKQRVRTMREELIVLEQKLAGDMKAQNKTYLHVVVGNEVKKLKAITRSRRIPLTYEELRHQLTDKFTGYFTGFDTNIQKDAFFLQICDQIWKARRINTEHVVDLLPRPKKDKQQTKMSTD